ncbi:transporter substrate-binding domain-containing protein [Mesorhizobium sp. M2A.F.Ca.ET.040.01.1.1]|nr:transporter substrate-binding domain-containing protein [Mesorhizobium sp. M2A.F.Ca.ET.040.01.1.1]
MRIALRIALAASAALLTLGVAQAQEKTLRIGTEGAYPPFNNLTSDGQLVGFDIDIAKALCDEMKVKCTFVAQDWDGIIPALTTKKIDAIVSSMSITAEREKTIDFSDKYYNTPTAIIGPKDQKFGATPDDLKGKVIGVQVSTVHAVYAKKHFTGAQEIKEYQTQDEANNDLAAGRIDAVQADSIALGEFLKSDQGKACCDLKGMVAPDDEVLGPGVGAGIRKEDTALKEKFNAGIKAIRANGKYDEISKKYFDFDIYGGATQSN